MLRPGPVVRRCNGEPIPLAVQVCSERLLPEDGYDFSGGAFLQFAMCIPSTVYRCPLSFS